MITSKVDGFTYTTAIAKLQKLTKRIRIIQGGTSAGKTYGIIPILIDKAARTPQIEISIVSETIPHLRKGAIRDFIKIMQATNRFIPEHWNKSNFVYTFGNGAFIEFFSADQQSKVRGPRRDILYINECNNVDFETYTQLAIRTKQTIWLDYNPTTEFWVHTEILNDADSDYLQLTYKDNEALSESIVQEIEKTRIRAFYEPNAKNLFAEGNIKSAYWANWWKVYGMGEVGSVQGVIFSNWQTVENIPQPATLKGVGIDFGFAQDPTAIVELYVCDGMVYLNEVCYNAGMTNNEIANFLKKQGYTPNTLIVADCAEPKSIAEINRYGFHLQPCVKGADSINFGIDLLQQFQLNVSAESVNLIKELRNYTWEKDRDGNSTGRPIDTFNHLIDALRYIAVRTLSQQTKRIVRGVIRRN